MSRRVTIGRIRNLEAQLATARERLNTKQEQLNVSMERVENLEQQLSVSRDRVENLQQQLAVARKRAAVNDELVAARDTYCRHLDGEVSRLSLDVKLLQPEVWSLYARVEQGVSIVSNLQSKLKASAAREAEKDRALAARAKEWAEFRKLLFKLNTRACEGDCVTVKELLSLSSSLLNMDI